MHCPECGFGFEDRSASDRRVHRRYHDDLLLGPRGAALRNLPIAQPLTESQSIRVVSSSSPKTHRRVAQDVSLVAAGDVDYTGVAYAANEDPEDRDPHIFIGVDGKRAISYAMLERRYHVWTCTWQQYAAKECVPVATSTGVSSVSFAWVSRSNRRQSWMRRTLDAAVGYLRISLPDLAWYTPFTPKGELLVRRLCPDRLLIGK